MGKKSSSQFRHRFQIIILVSLTSCAVERPRLEYTEAKIALAAATANLPDKKKVPLLSMCDRPLKAFEENVFYPNLDMALDDCKKLAEKLELEYGK